MSTFVLVHGSFLAAWCWRDVIARLETRGHVAVAFDLPGHGEDRTPIAQIELRDYVDATLRVVRSQRERPILVGHSMGAAVAGAAESDPGAIAALVFVAGLLPPPGAPMIQAVEQFDPAYLAQAVWAPDRRSARISLEGTRDFVGQCCPAEVVDEVVTLMRPEPMAPYDTPIVRTDARFGLPPRYYIETLRDRVVPLALQRSVQAQVGFARVFSLDADHLPFFSAPEALASSLDAVASEL